jgi:hypothetical protein
MFCFATENTDRTTSDRENVHRAMVRLMTAMPKTSIFIKARCPGITKLVIWYDSLINIK